MPTQTVDLTGLTCEGCVETVTEVVTGLPGVQDVVIDLHKGEVSHVTIEAERPLQRTELQSALSLVGAFEVQS